MPAFPQIFRTRNEAATVGSLNHQRAGCMGSMGGNMTDVEKIRFITLNYSRLQGLKAVPAGLLVFLVILWTNAQTGMARDLTLPVIGLFVAVLFYAFIDWYYHRTFGRVEQSGRSLAADVIFGAALAIIALGAEIFDGKSIIPMSVFPLVFAVGLALDYLRMCRMSGARSPAIFPAGLAFIGLIALSAFLPLLGNTAAREIGFRSPLFLVYGVDGILLTLFGLAEHLFLVRSMPRLREAADGKSV
jgi:hypothetical protein